MRTNIHSHTLRRESHAPSIVIRGQNMMVMCSTIASLRMSFICLRGGEHRNKSLEKENQKNKTTTKTLRSESRKKIYIIFSKKAEVKSSPNPVKP